MVSNSKTIYLSLGSNAGDRARQLERAEESLRAAGVRPLRRSSVYLTEPVGGIVQRTFLNCVLEAETARAPLELLRTLRLIEWALGRRRRKRLGPRAIDIDILFYGSRVVRMLELEIPHPGIARRRFVLVPMQEIASGLRHPVLRRSMAELLAATPDRSMVRRWRRTERSAD